MSTDNKKDTENQSKYEELKNDSRVEEQDSFRTEFIDMLQPGDTAENISNMSINDEKKRLSYKANAKFINNNNYR
jgi:hypothetical protein